MSTVVGGLWLERGISEVFPTSVVLWHSGAAVHSGAPSSAAPGDTAPRTATGAPVQHVSPGGAAQWGLPGALTLQGWGSTPYVSRVCAFLRKFSSEVAGVCPLREGEGRGGLCAGQSTARTRVPAWH